MFNAMQRFADEWWYTNRYVYAFLLELNRKKWIASNDKISSIFFSLRSFPRLINLFIQVEWKAKENWIRTNKDILFSLSFSFTFL